MQRKQQQAKDVAAVKSAHLYFCCATRFISICSALRWRRLFLTPLPAPLPPLLAPLPERVLPLTPLRAPPGCCSCPGPWCSPSEPSLSLPELGLHQEKGLY